MPYFLLLLFEEVLVRFYGKLNNILLRPEVELPYEEGLFLVLLNLLRQHNDKSMDLQHLLEYPFQIMQTQSQLTQQFF